MAMWMWLTVIIAGAFGQFVDAAAGMGFGALSSTIMIAGGISPALVVGTVSLAKVGSGLISGLAHWHFGNVQKSWVFPLAVPAVAGGVVGGLAITHVPEMGSRIWVPFILLLMGLLIIRRLYSSALTVPPVAGGSQDWAPALPQFPWHSLYHTLVRGTNAHKLGAIGFLGGALNGLSGAFGPLVTPLVVLVTGNHPRYAIGTVNFVEFFVAAAVSVTIISQLDWSAFRWELPLALMAGSILTAPLGAYLLRRLPVRAQYLVLGVTLVALNLWSLGRALA